MDTALKWMVLFLVIFGACTILIGLPICIATNGAIWEPLAIFAALMIITFFVEMITLVLEDW